MMVSKNHLDKCVQYDYKILTPILFQGKTPPILLQQSLRRATESRLKNNVITKLLYLDLFQFFCREK